jgi:hypothetical protein
MVPPAPDHFENVVVDDRWGHVTAERFALDDNPRAPGDEFSVCIVGRQPIAVFLGSPIAAAARRTITARRPDWLMAIVFADVASCDPALALIEAEIGSSVDADVARCAFAAVCVACDAGAFGESPSGYRVRIRRIATVLDVTIEFDDTSETWHGEVSRPSDLLVT